MPRASLHGRSEAENLKDWLFWAKAQPKPCARNAAGRGKKPIRRVSWDRMLDQVIRLLGGGEGPAAITFEASQCIIHRVVTRGQRAALASV
jgi:hypothetical protein